MMNLSDFIIIYLACGSPVGVWFYFNNKKSRNILLKSFSVTLFWLVFIAHLFYQRKFLNSRKNDKFPDLKQLQKNIENYLPENISIFVFREILSRYIGLSLIKYDKMVRSYNDNKEFSTAFGKGYETISSKCLQRKNLQKLNYHQISARNDFLKMITQVSEQINESIAFNKLIIMFVKMLKDQKTEIEIKKLIENKSQITDVKPVNKKELELWNNEKLKLQTANQTNFQLLNSKPQAIRMTSKD